MDLENVNFPKLKDLGLGYNYIIYIGDLEKVKFEQLEKLNLEGQKILYII